MEDAALYQGKRQWSWNPSGFLSGISQTESLPPGCQIYAEFTLRILDQLNARHHYGKANHWFNASNSVRGWMRFITLGLFNQANMGFVLKDACIVEADATVHGITDAL
ncbi:hypothetical protein FF1_021699 [Malus domestica]